MTGTHIDQTGFRKILARNLTLPLASGLVSAMVFVGLILYMLSVMNWVEHTQRVIASGNEISKLSVDLETGMRGFLLTNDDAFLAPYKLASPKLAVETRNLIALVSDNAPQVSRLQRVEALQGKWNEYALNMIAARRNQSEFQQAVKEGRGKLYFDEIRRELSGFLEIEQRLLQERTETARRVTITSVVLYLAFILLLNGLLAFFGRRELLQLSNTYGNALQEQTAHADTLQKQAWLRTGQTLLVEKGTGQLALPQLGSTALEFLAQYLHSVLGAIYLRQDDGSLHRFASYGYSRQEAQREQVIANGEGLLGQATLERRSIALQDVPADYAKVNSGLGDTPPRHVLIVPLNNEGKINGVMELGFMHDISPRDQEFLELVAGNLGTAIEASMARQRLQDLLAETQQLNEELQVQQEELRTANEELEEQSSVLEESQANLENQKAELEQNNERLAEQAEVLDSKNAALYTAQTQLEDRARELERASQYKSEFLANMSHELRTPLNSSLILAKLLSDNNEGNLSVEQVKFAQTIYSAGNDLLNLINDILDIAKVESGKLELNLDTLALSQLAESMHMTFSQQAAQKQLQLSVRVEPDLPAVITTDRQRLEQILKNLLSNALKFTERGSVTLNIHRHDADHIAISVQDTGIGIAADQQQAVFEAFHQADGTISRRYGGTGLGLSISRDLAALLQAEITLDSTPGQGSTFTLRLPVQLSVDQAMLPVSRPAHSVASLAPAARLQTNIHAPSQASTAAEADEPPLFPDDRDQAGSHARSVLVIEDEGDFARILYDLAHEMQYRCLVAHSAAQGLRLAVQQLPDAILLDMRLPDSSGLSLLQQLKEDATTRHIPVHVISASDHSEAALHLGAIGYAVKPTTRDELKQVFERLEQKFTQKIKRVLLVEDDARQRESVVQLIADDDVEITAVEFGEEAIARLRDTIFDCMIIDLKLPDMKGNELLQRMSTEEICSFPPVIIYTGRNLTREEEAELLQYSRSIIIKGARSPERLLDEVTLFLHKVESKLSSERQSMLKTVRSRDRAFEGRKILLVDDDVRNIFALTSALEQKGVTVEIARNGLEAIAQVERQADIDLVLMDVMMPEMDGLEATRRIRADGRFARLPIIAITAKAMKDDQEQCLQAGFNDYLAKPIDLPRLHSLLRVWMPNLDRL